MVVRLHHYPAPEEVFTERRSMTPTYLNMATVINRYINMAEIRSLNLEIREKNAFVFHSGVAGGMVA